MLDINEFATDYLQHDSDSLNILTVPFGVTLAKIRSVDSWTIKPSLDLTIRVNVVSDEVEAIAKWAGTSNL